MRVVFARILCDFEYVTYILYGKAERLYRTINI